MTGTDLAKKAGVDGYYVRFATPDQTAASAPASGVVDLKNHLPGQGRIAVADLVSPDALTLVRFGLRAADDPRIVNTVRVIDMLCKVDTPRGPCWHRYNHDGYGEHADGAPFDGTGVGRVWPLLTGERAHYELAAGRKAEADKLRRRMETLANDSGLLPEQIWDSPDIPERNLHFGRPSGSAMPLVWAHGEYVKLRRSLHDGRVFDTPQLAAERYLGAQDDLAPRPLALRAAVPRRACGQGAAAGGHGPGGGPLDQRRLADDPRHAHPRHRPRRPPGRPAHRDVGRGGRRGLHLPLDRGRPLGGERFSRDGDGWRGAASRRAAPAPSNGKKQSEPGKKAKGKKKQRR